MLGNPFEDYGPYIAALKERGIETNLAQTGGGCVALCVNVDSDSYIYTLGPSIDDRYNGFEVISAAGTTAYEPPDLHADLGPSETAALLAPALHLYLSGDKTPLPGWHVEIH